MGRTLSTAEERRTAVISAAIDVFAASGYRGTPVAQVASGAGISPAYVFRLFPTKLDLFVAALHACFDQILAALRDGVRDLPAAEADAVLAAMADAYAGLIADRKLIMMQVHAQAASDEPRIRAALADELARLVEYVTDRSGAGQPTVQAFFARGQLCHLVAALEIDSSRARWATQLTEGIVHHPGAS